MIHVPSAADRERIIAEICKQLSDEFHGAIGSTEELTVGGSFGDCSFCRKNITSNRHDKHDWLVCFDPCCQGAAAAQTERVASCLLDSPETRADALRWFRAKV